MLLQQCPDCLESPVHCFSCADPQTDRETLCVSVKPPVIYGGLHNGCAQSFEYATLSSTAPFVTESLNDTHTDSADFFRYIFANEGYSGERLCCDDTHLPMDDPFASSEPSSSRIEGSATGGDPAIPQQETRSEGASGSSAEEKTREPPRKDEGRRRLLEERDQDLDRLLSMFDPQECQLSVPTTMDQKSMPLLKAEAISPQSQPSTSHPSATYRDFFLPTATPTYQRPMHGIFTGFDFPRASFGGQPSELMPPPFSAQNFPAPSFIEAPHSHPPPAHQNTGHAAPPFQFPYGALTPGVVSESRRGSQGTLSSGSTGSVAGTPSPLNQPTSPPFGASANLMRFSVFNDPVGGTSSGLQAAASCETVGEEKLCAVCSDRAVCQHYGARTCEGCKGFFKRTVQKKAQYVCTGNKNCTIDKRFRSRCQYCRFQKCIAVGMVKEVVRYGSLSGRRGRLPSKTKLVHSDDPPSPPLPLLTLINKAYNDSKTTSETYSSFNGTVEQLLLALDEEFGSLMQFVEKIPGSSEISQCDTIALIELNFFALIALKLCNRWTEGSGLQLDRFEVDISIVPAPFKVLFAEIREEAIRFNRIIQWDASSFAALLALQFLNRAESPSEPLSSEAAADRLRGTITSALKDHCCSVSPPHTKKLQTIISQVEAFAKFEHLGAEALNACVAAGVQLPVRTNGVLLRSGQQPSTSAKMDFGEFSFCP